MKGNTNRNTNKQTPKKDMYMIYPKTRIKDPRVGEMSQQFRVLTALTKEIGSPGSKSEGSKPL